MTRLALAPIGEEEASVTIECSALAKCRCIAVSEGPLGLRRAVAMALAGCTPSSIEENGYRVVAGCEWSGGRGKLRRSVVSEQPRAEVSRFWTSVGGEIALVRDGAEADQWTTEVMGALGIGQLGSRRPETLSGGETTRMIIAAHLTRRPDVVLLDRCLDELDVAGRTACMKFIRSVGCISRMVVVTSCSDVAYDALVDPMSGRVEVVGPALPVSSDGMADVMSGGLYALSAGAGEGSEPRLRMVGCALMRQSRVIATDVTLRVDAGRITWLLGGNGSGKTTLFDAVLGLEPDLRITGPCVMDLGVLGIGYAPQDPDTDITERTLCEEVAAAVRGRKVEERTRAARSFLAGVGMEACESGDSLQDDPPRRRVASVLAALLRGSGICFLDEPTLWLSAAQRMAVVRAMKWRLAEGGAILCATHDNALIQAMDPAG